jgi:hypothetical protein
MGSSYKDQVAAARSSSPVVKIKSRTCTGTFINCEVCKKWRIADVKPPRDKHASPRWALDVGRSIVNLPGRKVCEWCYSHHADSAWLGWMDRQTEHPTKKRLCVEDLHLLQAAASAKGEVVVYPTTLPDFNWVTGEVWHPPTQRRLERLEESLSEAGRSKESCVYGTCRGGSMALEGEAYANHHAHADCHSAQLLHHVDLVYGFERFPEPCRKCLRLWEYPVCVGPGCVGCYNVPSECPAAFWRGTGGCPPAL